MNAVKSKATTSWSEKTPASSEDNTSFTPARSGAFVITKSTILSPRFGKGLD